VRIGWAFYSVCFVRALLFLGFLFLLAILGHCSICSNGVRYLLGALCVIFRFGGFSDALRLCLTVLERACLQLRNWFSRRRLRALGCWVRSQIEVSDYRRGGLFFLTYCDQSLMLDLWS